MAARSFVACLVALALGLHAAHAFVAPTAVPRVASATLKVSATAASTGAAGVRRLRRRCAWRGPGGAAALMAAGGGGGGEASASVDELIEEMLGAAPYDLPQIVSRSLKAVSSPSFFLAIAEQADAAAEGSDRQAALAALATTVMNTLEVIVQRTEEKVDTSAELVQSVLAAAAEEDGTGEFLVPLSEERLAALRAALTERLPLLDEAFFGTVNAYLKKAQDGGFGGMVTLLQNVLQQYAALALRTDPEVTARSEVDSAAGLLDKVLASDPEAWTALIAHELGKSDAPCSKDSLLSEVQARIETIVLGAGAGSYAQRVQAEFLKELTGRIQAAGDGGSVSNVVVE